MISCSQLSDQMSQMLHVSRIVFCTSKVKVSLLSHKGRSRAVLVTGWADKTHSRWSFGQTKCLHLKICTTHICNLQICIFVTQGHEGWFQKLAMGLKIVVQSYFDKPFWFQILWSIMIFSCQYHLRHHHHHCQDNIQLLSYVPVWPNNGDFFRV